MRKLTFILFIVVCLSMMAMAVYTLRNTNRRLMKTDVKLEVGQVWVAEYNLDNPYKKVQRDTLKILDLKNDYILYLKNGKDTCSDKRFWFLISTRLVK